MMENRRILSAIFGITQSVIGALSAILAVILFLDLIEFEAVINVPQELLPVCLLILVLFSVFSIISGSFLVHEHWR